MYIYVLSFNLCVHKNLDSEVNIEESEVFTALVILCLSLTHTHTHMGAHIPDTRSPW